MLKLTPKKKEKRTAGMRAGMTRAGIAEAAAELWLSGGATNFSIRALAKALDVVPATVRAHFKGGTGELLDEIARGALAQLTPPYMPQQDPKDYLRDFFRALLASSRKQPQLGRLVILRLSDDLLLSPIFAERIAATLAAIATQQDVASALRLFLDRLAGLVMAETASWLANAPEDVEARILQQTSVLSSAEFPTLKLAGEKLAADMMKRGAAGALDAIADAAAAALIAELAKGA
jgi:AcrR family transcriptional regulator